jgi:hypothetical protein
VNSWPHAVCLTTCLTWSQMLVCATLVVQISKHVKLENKEVDDVLGGEDAWKNVQKTDSKSEQAKPACPNHIAVVGCRPQVSARAAACSSTSMPAQAESRY